MSAAKDDIPADTPLEAIIAAAVKRELDAVGVLRPIAAVGLYPRRYVLASVAAAVTGYTEKAINQKIDGKVWKEGREWIAAPDGRRFIDLDNIEKWIESKARPQ